MAEETLSGEQNTIEQGADEALPETRPRIFFKSISFKDGTKINFGNNDIVVFVGGNNAGKSQALKDLENIIQKKGAIKKSIHTADIGKAGTVESLLNFIQKHELIASPYHSFNRLSPSYSESIVTTHWNNNSYEYFSSAFSKRIETENRITSSNAVQNFDTNSSPNSPLQLLHKNTPTEERISQYFQQTFGKELIVDKGAGKNISLLVGKDIPREEKEDRTSSTYRKRLLETTSRLEEQGDGMRSFASVILQTLADPIPSILLLDEPEAFLHPPQAKILGRLLATERPRDAQLFIATHSVDILMGLLEAAPENLHIIRLNRDSDKYAVELDKDKAREIMRNPLLRYSNVLSGAFYKRVILCEDSSDCLFYQALLGAMGKPVSDALFLHTSGKDRLNQLAEILQSLQVPVSIITDMDILQGGGALKNIITALRGDWNPIEKLWLPLKQAIEQEYPQKTAKVIHIELQESLTKLQKKEDFELEDIKKVYENTLKKSSPWPMLKRAGKNALPRDTARKNWKELQKLCAKIGLWIVPTGEIESFSDIGGHGPRWVGKILEEGDLETRKELEEARQFILAIWDNKPDDLN